MSSPSLTSPPPTTTTTTTSANSNVTAAAATTTTTTTTSTTTPTTSTTTSSAADVPLNKLSVGTVGTDSGGSFNKMVFFRPLDAPVLPSWVVQEKNLPSEVPGLRPNPNLKFNSGFLRFIKFPRSRTSSFIDFCSKEKLTEKFNMTHINMTGGGAYQYAEEITEKLNMKVKKLDEMATLIKGLNFLLDSVPGDEVFTVDPDTKEQHFGVESVTKGDYYPYLLVNMGSGVSILKITGPGQFERVSGTSLGGGTFWGLCKMLTDVNSWEEVQELSQVGNNENVDLLVGDIYGQDDQKYNQLGLRSNIIASSMGKAATLDKETPNDFKKEDIVRSLMLMLANNISQIAYLVASLHGIKNVFFAGGFISQSTTLWNKFSFAIKYWSQGQMQALFLRHNEYLGALGALIQDDDETDGVIDEST